MLGELHIPRLSHRRALAPRGVGVEAEEGDELLGKYPGGPCSSSPTLRLNRYMSGTRSGAPGTRSSRGRTSLVNRTYARTSSSETVRAGLAKPIPAEKSSNHIAGLTVTWVHEPGSASTVYARSLYIYIYIAFAKMT